MFFRNVENEKRLWLQYGIILVAVAVCVISMMVYAFSTFVDTAKERTLQMADALNQKDAGNVESFLNRGETVLKVSSGLMNDLLERNVSLAKVESLLVSEYKYYSDEHVFGVSNMFGVFREQFFTGGKWAPAEGYVPSRRPWYQDALMARGKVAFVATHLNPRNNEQVISISQRLSDKKSVLAIDLSLKNLHSSIGNWNHSDTWMIIDKNGLVIAHSNVTQQGRNYLSSEFWGSNEEKLAQEVLIANSRPFLFNYNRKDYQVFSSLIKDKWYLVRLVDNVALLRSIWVTVAKNVVIVVALYILFVILMTMCFMHRLQSIRMSRAKSGFLTNLSREIRTSVTGILGMNSIVLKEIRDDSLKDYLGNIQSVGQSVLSLVNDVLDVTKIESGKMSIVSMEYDVFSVLSSCYSENAPKAAIKNLHFSVDCNPDIPSSLWGDENRIRQILNNLLSNAIKFTEVGEVSLSVGFEKLHAMGTLKSDDYVMLEFTVKDSGIGISKEEEGDIFNKFNTQGAVDGAIEGAGLGLSLTRELVVKCGGQISMSSKPGEGSVFVVRIPQLVLNVEPMGDFAMRFRNASRKKTDVPKVLLAPDARILIVDDVEMNLKIMRGFLRNTRAQVDVAVSGVQCLKMASSKLYDLILLDHMMPVMDGIETYRRLQNAPDGVNKDTPVIVLTSDGYSDSNESFLEEGFTDYLPKPIKERDLLRVLKWYLPKQLVLSGEDLQEEVDSHVFENVHEGYGVDPAHTWEDNEIELQAVTELSPLEKLKPFKDTLDIKKGLEYCADDAEIFMEMLQEYVSSPLHRNVETCYKNQDWENYRFYMHVLCDASSAIGAMEMAEKFRNLENLCRESRFSAVHEKHGLVMALHAELLKNIQKGME